MKQKKSQITIFIIMALVLVIVASAFFYLKNSDTETKISEETTKIQKTSIEPIENYVNLVLDKTAKQGLLLLGRQGGFLYQSQGGPLIDYKTSDEGAFFVNYNNYDVSYAIYPLRFDIWPHYTKAPSYPWETFPYPDSTSTDESFKGLFGISNLPPINSSFGANSIKSQLEFYIQNNIQKSIDWSIFKEQGYEITESNLSVEVKISEEEVSFHLTYPLTIKNKATDEVAAIQDFYVKKQIRLKQILYFAQDIINKDITDIKFDISTAQMGGLTVNVMKNIFEKDDLIMIKDKNSLIDKEPYTFIFARHNRMPALHYISPISITLPNLHNITDADLITGGISTLIAYDPDEDIIAFDAFSIEPSVPKTLGLPTLDFHIKATDGELEDYQIITVIRG